MNIKKTSTFSAVDVDNLFVTLLIGAVAACFAWPQIFPDASQTNELNLPNLGKRAEMLAQISDPVQREQYCIGLSAYGRALDRAIQPDAKIFMSDVVGKENSGHLAFYYFLRNYLFPRDMEISLGNPAVLGSASWFDGTNCDSPEILKTNGFDLQLKFGPDGNIQIQPLTEKGMPKQ